MRRRNWSPCRVCGREHTNPMSSSICPTCGRAESESTKERAEHERREREEEYKYMPASYRLMAELAELTSQDTADKIKELFTALMDEREYDRSPDREYD